jgi:hypothetical protein
MRMRCIQYSSAARAYLRTKALPELPPRRGFVPNVLQSDRQALDEVARAGYFFAGE